MMKAKTRLETFDFSKGIKKQVQKRKKLKGG